MTSRILLVEDELNMARTLAKNLERAGYAVTHAPNGEAALGTLAQESFDVILTDLKMPVLDGMGLLRALHDRSIQTSVIVLTGYGAIASAVAAVKIGAIDYLSKPADAAELTQALLAREGELPEPPENPMSADRVRWEHIQRVYEMCDRNVSETARRLGMHRRTLQRILAKRAPR